MSNFNLIYATGYVSDALPQDIFDELKNITHPNNFCFSSAEPYNFRLAGNLKHEYRLQLPNELNEKLLVFLNTLVVKYYSFYNITPPKFVFNQDYDQHDLSKHHDALWVNYQKKHEFNPPHFHTGILSFVIWISVPFSTEEEQANYSNSNTNVSSKFFFQYIDPCQNSAIASHYLNVDKKFEGTVLLFPSNLQHGVFPFYTSDDYRISISGNLTNGNST